MSFIPSCDDREDAIISLSQIYAVSAEEIDMILLNPEVQEIADVYSEIHKPAFHYVITHLLKAPPRVDITHAYYYHSTSYDGCPSWFDEGLLGSSQGVERFIDKIVEWLPSEKQLSVKHAVMEIVKCRSEFEGSIAEGCRPYAWCTFTAACSSRFCYRVPEAIQDLWSPNLCGNGALVDLSRIIEERLKPVVVKFKGEISDIDDYCATLWAYLLSDNDECQLIHTFRGNGLALPKENIVALMEVRPILQ
jgi:hypothetical protein